MAPILSLAILALFALCEFRVFFRAQNPRPVHGCLPHRGQRAQRSPSVPQTAAQHLGAVSSSTLQNFHISRELKILQSAGTRSPQVLSSSLRYRWRALSSLTPVGWTTAPERPGAERSATAVRERAFVRFLYSAIFGAEPRRSAVLPRAQRDSALPMESVELADPTRGDNHGRIPSFLAETIAFAPGATGASSVGREFKRWWVSRRSTRTQVVNKWSHALSGANGSRSCPSWQQRARGLRVPALCDSFQLSQISVGAPGFAPWANGRVPTCPQAVCGTDGERWARKPH